jgi:hypothetical protein
VNTNVAEYKSAWMIVDKDNPPENYFVVDAQIPHYVVKGDTLVQDEKSGKPVFDQGKVALLAIHVVFTLPGHPEMIWSTFEHVHLDKDGNAVRDNAPAASDNPSSPILTPETEISGDNFPLYKAHTKIKDANEHAVKNLKDIVPFWDEKQQAFSKGGAIFQTSVYRPYPGSKTDGSTANPDHSEDSEVIEINRNVTKMFTSAKANGTISDVDRRQNYRLVGATWLNQPLTGHVPSFKVKQFFGMKATESTDDDATVSPPDGQRLAGEGRLGSTAMESFTEFENGEPSCFSCHDTNAVRHVGQLIPPARMNVSHVLSKFVADQTGK